MFYLECVPTAKRRTKFPEIWRTPTRLLVVLAILLAVTVMGFRASLALASDDVCGDLVVIGEYRSTADYWRDTASELIRKVQMLETDIRSLRESLEAGPATISVTQSEFAGLRARGTYITPDLPLNSHVVYYGVWLHTALEQVGLSDTTFPVSDEQTSRWRPYMVFEEHHIRGSPCHRHRYRV